MLRKYWWNTLVLMLAFGCGSEDAAPRPGAPHSAPQESVEVRARPETPEAAADREEDERQARVLQEHAEVFEQTVEEAVTAARNADGAASLCDAAYESVQAMLREVAEQYPDRVRSMPPRLAFMNLCRRLPEPAQQCLVASYAVENIQECAHVQSTIPEEDRRRLEELLRGG